MNNMKVLEVLVFSKGQNETFVLGLSPWLALAAFSLCPRMVSSLHTHGPGVPLCVQISSSYKDTVSIRVYPNDLFMY